MAPLTRRGFLGAAAGSVLSANAPKTTRPNIVWIMADDLGYSDLGCYGQKYIRTPNVDKLADEGMRFTDAYAGCTVCAPSRSVLMTGHHMGHTSVRANTGGVPLLSGDLTVAEVLKEAGYATGLFGKWGLGDLGTEGVPTKQGFDEYTGYLSQVHAHLYYPKFIYRNGRELPLRGNGDGKRVTYSHDVIADDALAFIRRNKDRPFFCYVPFTLPHWELLVPEDSMAEYRGKFPEPALMKTVRRHYAIQNEPHAAYAGMITRMDRDVGRIMRQLSDLKLDENTLVIFTSDNGAALPILGDDFFKSRANFRGHKQNFYEGGIRVPSIARWPGRINAGTVNSHPWYFCDFLPTAAELAGAHVPRGLDGHSIVPALLGEKAAGRKQPVHEFMYWEQPRFEKGFPLKEIPSQALRTSEWKAVRAEPNGPLELYNLSEDVSESKNLAGAKPDVLKRIEEYLRNARTEPRPQSEPPSPWWEVVD